MAFEATGLMIWGIGLNPNEIWEYLFKGSESLTNEKKLLLYFLVPYLLGGTYFAVSAFMYLKQLPSELNGSLDYFYAITLAYQDMGIACGIGGLVVFDLMMKIRGLFKRE